MKRTFSTSTKRTAWLALRVAVAAGLVTSCGSEGSLATSGSTDWSFDGMPRTDSKGGSSTSAGGASKPGSSASGGAPTGSSGGQGSSTPGTAAAGTASTGAGSGSGSGSGRYHQLTNWTEPQSNNPNHHGRVYFLGNAHKDENGVECSSCHGKSYEGGDGPACATCHTEWRSSCTFCHGTAGVLGGAPPRGIWDETTPASLAVGHHSAHLTAGDSHQAFACTSCHKVPAADDVEHTLGYQASADLSTPGHHGDVDLTAALPGMTWGINATSGTPVSARGSCVGGCHSDGRGGPPVTTAYWAGGTWATGCGNCHAAKPKSGHHGHALEEGGTCANCHAGSTTSAYATAAHLNGQNDYLGTIAGEGMTLKADPSCASGVRCNGTCHGENEEHNNKCW